MNSSQNTGSPILLPTFLGRWLPLPLHPWFLGGSSCVPITRCSGKSSHCCQHRLCHKPSKNLKGPLQVHPPCPVTGSWTKSSPGHRPRFRPGSVQPAPLSPALPFPILCCPLVATQPIEQPEHKTNAILTGSHGAHVTGS